MDRGVGAAVRPLPESGRKDLAIQALAGSETVSGLAVRHGVSRKFVYQQTHKARAALDEAFSSATPDEAVLFELAVTKTWLRQVIVGLTLICRGSYRGVVEFLRDLLGVPVSLGCVHDVLQSATRQASVINSRATATLAGQRHVGWPVWPDAGRAEPGRSPAKPAGGFDPALWSRRVRAGSDPRFEEQVRRARTPRHRPAGETVHDLPPSPSPARCCRRQRHQRAHRPSDRA